jgi:hypothetical protein
MGRSSAARPDLALPAKHLMYERDGNRAFADGRCDALDVAATDISNREDAGTAGFK